MDSIPFNKPYFTGKEIAYIQQAITSGKISGDGTFTKNCHEYFEKKYGFKKCLLTSSCTDALEMAAILTEIAEGDEVIMPSYTFVSTANAFILRGAKIVFADSSMENPNIFADQIESLVTPRTKVIVPVHYAGIACDMDKIMDIAGRHKLFVIEDAAHATDSFYKGKPLGSIGQLAAFSFHDTKNIRSGEGGMLVINDHSLAERAEIIREKGTNRAAFMRGEVDKYGWVDVGSSFLPSDMIAAFLYGQLEKLEDIQERRKGIWNVYYRLLTPLAEQGKITLPFIPEYATNNGNMFYIVCKTAEERQNLIDTLKKNNIQAVFHYLSLHRSKFFESKHDGRPLAQADRYSDCLLRLPLYYSLTEAEIRRICGVVMKFFGVVIGDR